MQKHANKYDHKGWSYLPILVTFAHRKGYCSFIQKWKPLKIIANLLIDCIRPGLDILMHYQVKEIKTNMNSEAKLKSVKHFIKLTRQYTICYIIGMFQCQSDNKRISMQ